MDKFALVIFGITSNLAQIKLIPALYDMAEDKSLPKGLTVLGISRKPMSKDELRNYLWAVLNLENYHHKHEIKKDVFEKLVPRFHHLAGEVSDPNLFKKLAEFFELESKKGFDCYNRMYYLATYPNLYKSIFDGLKSNRLDEQRLGWVRLLIEKPIGGDLKSAKKLNQLLDSYFDESQIYRLDHYLGKETLQNILAFRFGNGVFSPLVNRRFVDHIQVTASESFGIGKRGGYYDPTGAFVDVGQNHILQMIAFAAMGAPREFSNAAVTRERIEFIKKLRPMPRSLVLGQYEGYTKEEHVDPKSKTDTFFSFKTELMGGKLAGVPIYVRAGKALSQTVTEVAIVFKNPASRLFGHLEGGLRPNILIYRIQPNEGIILQILSKKPGHKIKLVPSFMQFCYRHLPGDLIDPYERLIYDAMEGDQTFFNDAAEVEAEWRFVDAISKGKREPVIYRKGSWGPKEANRIIEADGRKWLTPSMDFCTI
jgi:glucose-6-phosphate 1-dehydrogenase